MDAYSIGVDLGGTNLRAAAVDESGRMLDKISGRTEERAGGDALADGIAESIETLRSRMLGRKLAGVGVGVPGIIRMGQGMVAGSPNLPYLEDYPIRDRIEQRLGTRVILETDANAAALGEKWMGAGRGVDDLVLLTLGTGIGGGIIVGGRVLHGSIGMAGELGHITVSPNGYPCGCGNRGCVEKYASATAISAMARLLNLGPDVGAEQVYRLAQDGNARAISIFTSMGAGLGIALAALINIFNFSLYLIGGGSVVAWDLFAPSMLAEVESRSYTYRKAPTRIERAALGSEAGLYGAAYLPFGG